MKKKLFAFAPRLALAGGAALALHLATMLPARGQDAVKVDPKHYTVEFENDRVRVLRVRYGPHEKSVMHEHPDSVGVYLTDAHIRITLPDGRSGDPHVKEGHAMWHATGQHLPENIGETPLEFVLVEFKTPPPAGQ